MTHATPVSGRAPWHLWVVGVIAVLWNGYACYDYVMTQTGGADYLRAFGFTQAQIDYYMAMPAWAIALWAVGVWGGLLGGVLLLLRSRWAALAFLASLAAFVLSLVYTYALSSGADAVGTQGAVMNVIIGAGCVLFVWYAWTMRKRSVLR